MKRRSFTYVMLGAVSVAFVFLLGARQGAEEGRYRIAATSAETAGGYNLAVFVLDSRTGVVKQAVADHEHQLGKPFGDMRNEANPEDTGTIQVPMVP